MPDGQSYFASGDQLENYSTCNDQKPTGILLDGSTTGPINLDTTAINGVPYVFGLAGSEWLELFGDHHRAGTGSDYGQCQLLNVGRQCLPVHGQGQWAGSHAGLAAMRGDADHFFAEAGSRNL